MTSDGYPPWQQGSQQLEVWRAFIRREIDLYESEKQKEAHKIHDSILDSLGRQ